MRPWLVPPSRAFDRADTSADGGHILNRARHVPCSRLPQLGHDSTRADDAPLRTDFHLSSHVALPVRTGAGVCGAETTPSRAHSLHLNWLAYELIIWAVGFKELGSTQTESLAKWRELAGRKSDS